MAGRKEVWTVSPRGEGKKDFWLRVGTAFENRDGSWALVLDALPINGKLIVREPKEFAEEEPPRRRQPQQSAHENAKRNAYQRDDDGEIPF